MSATLRRAPSLTLSPNPYRIASIARWRNSRGASSNALTSSRLRISGSFRSRRGNGMRSISILRFSVWVYKKRSAHREETESSGAMNGTENPASTNRWMEEVCERENLKEALRRVKANQGSAGVDGMTVGGITDYLKQHWPAIREQLLNATYEPRPVRRVEIPKPDGGVRKLGIPTVLDRLIQQAVMQVLQKQWDPTFSEHSHGFRPKRSAHQAVAKAQQYIAAGHRWVVDLDLEKFFDRVNHDKLMAA